MIYIVWMKGDGNPALWFFVVPTKKQAMQEAKTQLSVAEEGEYPKGIIYAKDSNNDNYYDLACQGYLVVQQTASHYHGA